MKFRRGDRVRLNGAGRKQYSRPHWGRDEHYFNRLGTVRYEPRTDRPSILWDGCVASTSVHERFLEKVQNPREGAA